MDEISRQGLLQRVAAHESGHAVAAWFSPGFKEVSEVFAIVRAQEDGPLLCEAGTSFACLSTAVWEQMVVLLSGSIATDLCGWPNDHGGKSDHYMAVNIACDLFGRTAIFQVIGHKVGGMQIVPPWPCDKTLFNDFKEILAVASQRSLQLLTQHREGFEKLRIELAKHERISSQGLLEILGPRLVD